VILKVGDSKGGDFEEQGGGKNKGGENAQPQQLIDH